MLLPILLAFVIPVLITLIITPGVIRLAHKIGATDKPDERKVHTVITPRIGGVAVFTGVISTIVIITLLFPDIFSEFSIYQREVVLIAFSLIAVFTLGFWDDLSPLKPGIKFAFQFAIAALIYFAGFKISTITNPMGAGMISVELIDFPLTLLWIVGITNAFNLIDGLDGLASGVATIACVSIFTVSAVSGQIWPAILSLTLAGALVGFLRYNFNPAKIFLGDSGSLFVGFCLALLAIQSTAKFTTGFAILFPLLVLVLPIADTLISMFRRLMGGYLKEADNGIQSSLSHKLHRMFTPDKSHIHHQLLSFGFTHRNTVLLLYLVSGFFALSAFAVTQIDSLEKSILAVLIIGPALILGIKKLRYHEIAILNNGLMMPLYEKWIMHRPVVLSLVDTFFIIFSFSISYLLVRGFNPDDVQLLRFDHTVALLISIQVAVLWISGLYRENLTHIGIGNAINITRSVTYAIGASAILLLFKQTLPTTLILQFLTFNFYFLLTFILGVRIAYQAMRFWFHRDRPGGEQALIYGANENGALLLHKINNSQKSNIRIVGFLDDAPEMEGQYMQGYPVIGSHWKLGKKLNTLRVDTIYLCSEQIKAEDYKRLLTISDNYGIQLKKVQMSIQDIPYSPAHEGQPAMNLFAKPTVLST
jgi:UDP-GlcNAc:undecaprenyl-phosphate/decaprenyl-phosphate GlcNAc-1-phosphate transferase